MNNENRNFHLFSIFFYFLGCVGWQEAVKGNEGSSYQAVERALEIRFAFPVSPFISCLSCQAISALSASAHRAGKDLSTCLTGEGSMMKLMLSCLQEDGSDGRSNRKRNEGTKKQDEDPKLLCLVYRVRQKWSKIKIYFPGITSTNIFPRMEFTHYKRKVI